jgi:dienelactone hydrolase
MKKLIVFFVLAASGFTLTAQDVKTALMEYREGETVLEGYMAYDAAVKGKRPAVIVVHEWTGINEYTKKRCEELARMGYLAFAADIYGKGIRPGSPREAGKEAAKYKGDRSLMRKRITAALEQVKNQEIADPAHIAAIGYCFGGTVALELARSGAPISGVVSFHGGLDTPSPEASAVKARLLICHGAVDPFVPKEQVDTFLKEMNDAGVDYQFIAYANAVHSFTNPGAGDDPSKGAAYNRQADVRSWKAMQGFFQEIFPHR